jgi:lactate dehydrogenase-like 2-hydroxyacid dehydrogenase
VTRRASVCLRVQERDREEAAEWAQAAEVAGLEDAGSMEELLATSDIVSLHCAACEETVGILSEDVFAHFKQGLSPTRRPCRQKLTWHVLYVVRRDG